MSLIKMPSELVSDSPISCLLYGQPGVGKTSLAISAERPLLIDLERGILRVAKKNQCPSVQVESYEQVLEVINSDEISEFKTIVIDTFGKLVDRMGDWLALSNPKLKQADGSLSMKGWGAIKLQSQLLTKTLFSKNKNVIFVAHEREERDGDDRILRPDISGSAGKDLVKDLDLMGYMQVRNGKRTVCFSPNDRFYAKNSLGLSGYLEIPDNSVINNFFDKAIVKEVARRRQEDNAMREQYEALINRQSESIEHISTVDDLNIAYKALSEQEPIWDSEISWKRKLKDRADLLKAVFNKVSGVFENANNSESI